MEKIFWTLQFLVMRHVCIYPGVLTPKTVLYDCLAFNSHDIMETLLLLQNVGLWWAISQSLIIGPILFEDGIKSEHYCELILFPIIGCLNEDDITYCYF
jgi:hypothetical protein